MREFGKDQLAPSLLFPSSLLPLSTIVCFPTRPRSFLFSPPLYTLLKLYQS